MKTGVIYGLSFKEYCAIDAINCSGLKKIKQSPLHYWAEYLSPDKKEREETPAMYRGTAIHTAVLEPKRFAEEYRKEPKPEDYPAHLNTNDDIKAKLRAFSLPLGGNKAELVVRLKEFGQDFLFFEDVLKEHEKYKLLKNDDWEACQKISDGVRKKPALSVLFETGSPEVTLVWKDKETGMMCKARADWLTQDGMLVDIKSSTDASMQEFAWSFERYKYWQQAAWYLDGVRATMGVSGTFILAAFETAYPYATAVYMPDDQAIEDGRNENKFLLDRYIECLNSKSWPGYSDEIQTMRRPIYREKGKSNDK